MGESAMKAGLIDKLGGYNDALQYLWKLAGEIGEPVIKERENQNFLTALLQSSSRINDTPEAYIRKLNMLGKIPLALMLQEVF